VTRAFSAAHTEGGLNFGKGYMIVKIAVREA
jgi:hypothetical protein